MVKVLVVEDNPATSSLVGDTLGKARGVKRILATQPSTAIEMVKEDSFDVALIDLRLSESLAGGPIYNGIQLGEDIRRLLPGAVIVMYSGDIVPKKEEEFPYHKHCKKAGADYVVSRESILEKSASVWGETLAEWTTKKHAEQGASRPLENETDWNTLGVLENIGKDALGQMIRAAIPGMARDRIRALNAGFSGSFILWITSSTTGDKRDVENILKVSDSPDPLQEELRRAPVVGTVLDLHGVVPHTPRVSWGKWSAFAVRPVKNAMILRDFLLHPDTKREDTRVFKDMIDSLLVLPASRASSAPSGKTRQLISYSAGSQMLEALETISGWKRSVSGVAGKDLTLVRKFIERSLAGHWTVCGNCHVAQLHGDFHARNIFVSSKEGAVLIDFARSEEFPRLLDFAALETDLLVSVLASNNGEDQHFGNVDRWYSKCVSSFPFRTAVEKANGKEARLDLLRRLLHARMKSGLDDIASVEYSEALLFQLLRYLRFPTTTAPKKVLALRLAASLIAQHRLGE